MHRSLMAVAIFALTLSSCGVVPPELGAALEKSPKVVSGGRAALANPACPAQRHFLTAPSGRALSCILIHLTTGRGRGFTLSKVAARAPAAHRPGMLANLVMTVIGPDRPGIVEALASRVARHGGNWLESRMCRLGGQFTGIVRAEIPPAKIDELTLALRSLEADGLRIHLHIEKADRPAVAGTLASLAFVGQDRPGILLQISSVLSSHRVNVEELASERISAPMDGSMLFQARATVLLPPDLSLASLRTGLEKIASDLMVDVQLQPK